MSSVIVVNARKVGDVPEGYTRVYVGRRTSYRPELGEDYSSLGNPYTINAQDTREFVIQRYTERLAWLLSEPESDAAKDVRSLAARVRRGERLALVCWCAPQACHADVIAAALQPLPEQG